MVARSTLEAFHGLLALVQNRHALYSLFRIVGGVCEDSWECQTRNAISKRDHHTLVIGVNEVLVEKKQPDRLHEFSTAVLQNFLGGWTAKLLLIPVLQGVRELRAW